MIFYFQTIEIIHEFTDEEIKMLNSTPISKESDSIYIRYLLEFLYKDDRNVLKNRSLTGQTTKKNIELKCISPDKKDIIFDLFTKRLLNPKISLQEKSKRMEKTYIGRRIAVAIGTIRKSTANENASGPLLSSG